MLTIERKPKLTIRRRYVDNVPPLPSAVSEFSLTIQCGPEYTGEGMHRARTHVIHDFILEHVASDPKGVARRVVEAYGISRQAANRHLDAMVEAGLLEQAGHTRAKEYRLRRASTLTRELRVTPVLNPDRVFDDHIAPILAGDRPAVRDLCRGAFGELVRNAATHAGAAWITFSFTANARHIEIAVSDDGRGFFATLGPRLGAPGPREAAEEVARLARLRDAHGPASRLLLLARNFESFTISSGGCVLEFDGPRDLWVVRDGEAATGTQIILRALRNPARASAETTRELSVR